MELNEEAAYWKQEAERFQKLLRREQRKHKASIGFLLTWLVIGWLLVLWFANDAAGDDVMPQLAVQLVASSVTAESGHSRRSQTG